MALVPVVKVVDLYRHDQLEDGYGIEWIGGGNEDEHQQQPETISVRSVQTNCEHLPTQIRRSLSKILPGDVVVELNGVSTVNMGMREFIKNLKLSGSRVRIRLKSDYSGYSSPTCQYYINNSHPPSWHSPSSLTQSEDNDETLSDNDSIPLQSLSHLTNGHSSNDCIPQQKQQHQQHSKLAYIQSTTTKSSDFLPLTNAQQYVGLNGSRSCDYIDSGELFIGNSSLSKNNNQHHSCADIITQNNEKNNHISEKSLTDIITTPLVPMSDMCTYIQLEQHSGSNSTADYDNIENITGLESQLIANGPNNSADDKQHQQQLLYSGLSPPSIQRLAQGQIFQELDQKTKQQIDERLKHLEEDEDNHENHSPITSEAVNKSVDLPSACRLAKRLYLLDGFKSTDVMRHLCKRYFMLE